MSAASSAFFQFPHEFIVSKLEFFNAYTIPKHSHLFSCAVSFAVGSD